MEKGKVGAVMIVGGGIGGIQAALDLAESGIKVYIVERLSAIGGIMSMLDKTFPTNDCAMCTLAPRLVSAGRNPDIEIISEAEVEKIEGEPGNFTVTIKKKARYIDLSKCTGCGACVEKCPVELKNEYDLGLSIRKAIHKRYPQAVPSGFAITKEGTSPCIFGCPAGVSPHAFVSLIARGRYEEAIAIHRRENPFLAICGRICPHGCELECRRKDLDEPISIAGLKRFLADWEFANPDKKPPLPENLKTKNEKVAVVGSGPAGLSCAYYLALKGYHVTIFEALPVAGGMLRVGVPAFRLPREILEKEIQDVVLRLGVELRLNTKVTSLEELKAQGFKAIFLAIGAHKDLKLNIPGEDSNGVMSAVAFLKDVNLGNKIDLSGKRVVVIGGGNTAVDSARCALRLGASEVILMYSRSRNEMPANPWEVEEAEKEGVKIIYLVAPVSINAINGNVSSVKLVRMRLEEPDASGRRRPVPIEGSEFEIPADIVISAIGQKVDLDSLPKDLCLERTKLDTIVVDPETLQTTIEGVFAGGDVVSGPATAVEAIQAGKIAAESIDRYLSGKDLKEDRRIKRGGSKAVKDIRGIPKKPRVKMPTLPLNERIDSFKEVALGYTEEQALEEARRCLECGICCECLLCVEACEAKAINHAMEKEETVKINVGAIILCPGFEVFDPKIKESLGYGKYSNVVTSLQFERLLSPSGPTSGKILRLSDWKPPKKIAWIQCVGSRERERDWCSSVCCMYATKEAIIAKEHAGDDLQCDIYFMDIRAFSKGFEQYFEIAKKQGIRYIRCRIPKIEEDPETKNLIITYLDESERKRKAEYDMVVLSVGISPPKDAKGLSEKFGIDLNEFGFASFSTFEPVKTNKEGIYVAGPFTEPKDIPETVMQASASASKAMTLLSDVKGRLIKPVVYPEEIDVRGQEPRIGVFICHCGTNIAGVVDVDEVTEYAKTLPNVVYAVNNKYTCSNDTQQLIKQKIKELNLNRIVVAACTPRTHEPLFRNTLREAGLNPYLFEMANIRDQNSWVHMHYPEEATKKAKDLVRIAVAKARLLEPLQKSFIGVIKSALVVGGGIAGMKSALELANQGYKVFLLEKTDKLGGNLRNIYYLLNGEDPQEELEKIIKEVKENKNIEIYFSSKIESVEGSVGNFRTRIKSNGREYTLAHGVVIIAIGGKEYEPKEYMYGEDERVLTQRQLEERIAKNNIKLPRTVVMIQCVGSREGGRPSCSRICCSVAIKNALKIKEISPSTNVYVLYRDIRTYGFKEKYYTMARDKGVVFIRWDINDGKPIVYKENGRLFVDVKDKILNMVHTIPADLIVLSTGVIPNEDYKEIAQLFKVPVTSEGYFLEAHMKLRPVDFATDGVFLCGLAHFPKTIDETIIQAQAAAARASTILSKDKLELEATISKVVDENCDGCAYCVETCPFKAITLLEYVWRGTIKKVVESNESLCKGCGTCMATCPKKGIYVKGFTLEQLQAQVFAALEQF